MALIRVLAFLMREKGMKVAFGYPGFSRGGLKEGDLE